MKKCYNLQTCSQYSTLQEDLRICKSVGFSAVEIDFAKANVYLSGHTIVELSALLKEYEMECVAINAVFNINFCNQKEWEEVCRQVLFACDLCEASGADKIIVLSSETLHNCGDFDRDSEEIQEKIFRDTVYRLQLLADLVREHGLKIAFEPVGTMLVPSIKMAWDIVKTVNRKEVGLVLDDFNLFLWNRLADVNDIRCISPDKILIVHLNDAENIPFEQLDQTHRCMPGDGCIPVSAYMDCVKSTGYDGYVSVEVLNPRLWKRGPEKVIPEAYIKMNRFVTD